jgi:hypothetical protein
MVKEANFMHKKISWFFKEAGKLLVETQILLGKCGPLIKVVRESFSTFYHNDGLLLDCT